MNGNVMKAESSSMKARTSENQHKWKMFAFYGEFALQPINLKPAFAMVTFMHFYAIHGHRR